jgi:hypothetical protein
MTFEMTGCEMAGSFGHTTLLSHRLQDVKIA